MGINVELRRESGEILGEVDSDMVLSRATSGPLAATRLLRYLEPWGDAMFNAAQAADLRDDIQQVLRDHRGSPLAATLAKIQPLVEMLSTETHVYLWFIGD